MCETSKQCLVWPIIVQRFETKRSCYCWFYGFSPLLFIPPCGRGTFGFSCSSHCFWMRKIKFNHNNVWNWISYTRLSAIMWTSVLLAIWAAAVDKAFSIYTSAPLLNMTKIFLVADKRRTELTHVVFQLLLTQNHKQQANDVHIIITSTPTVLTCKYITSFNDWRKAVLNQELKENWSHHSKFTCQTNPALENRAHPVKCT